MCSIVNTVNEMEGDYKYINKTTTDPKQFEVQRMLHSFRTAPKSLRSKGYCNIPQRPDSCLHSQNQVEPLAK